VTDPLASGTSRNLALAAIDEAFQEAVKNCFKSWLTDLGVDMHAALTRIGMHRDAMREAVLKAFG